DGNNAARAAVIDLRVRPREPLVQRESLRRIDDVDQVVRHALAFVDGRLGRADIHAPIHLVSVGRDDLGALEPVRERNGESGLASGGGTHNDGKDFHKDVRTYRAVTESRLMVEITPAA